MDHGRREAVGRKRMDGADADALSGAVPVDRDQRQQPAHAVPEHEQRGVEPAGLDVGLRDGAAGVRDLCCARGARALPRNQRHSAVVGAHDAGRGSGRDLFLRPVLRADRRAERDEVSGRHPAGTRLPAAGARAARRRRARLRPAHRGAVRPWRNVHGTRRSHGRDRYRHARPPGLVVPTERSSRSPRQRSRRTCLQRAEHDQDVPADAPARDGRLRQWDAR
jgi:hypothetical protein